MKYDLHLTNQMGGKGRIVLINICLLYTSSPTDIMALLDAGKAEGLGIGADGTMFGIDTINTAAIGSYLIGTRVPDFLGLMDGIQWMDDFNEKKASFGGVWDGSQNLSLIHI